jgi:phosphoribosylformylglycinamidine cyclo-ligase
VFPFLAGHGGIGQDEMERVFNMGAGMVAVVAPDDAGRGLRLLADRGVPAWAAGQVTQDDNGARLVGTYRA